MSNVMHNDMADPEEDEFYDVQELETHEHEHEHNIDTIDSDNNMLQFPSNNNQSHADREQLEKCGQWLLSVPRDDVVALRTTPEYGDFLKAFEKLGQAHRRVLAMNDTEQLDKKKSVPNDFSFLQHMAVDDVVLRVLELLECQSLIRTSETCSRFRELAHRSATQRTHDVAKSRQLNHVMKLLRAKEQMDGSSSSGAMEEINHCHVPVPIMGLEKRVIVTDAGDPEYNGVYYCTGCDGNGFIFTKPRNAASRATTTNSVATTPVQLQALDNIDQLEQLMMHNNDPDNNNNNNELPGPGNKEEPTKPGELLRCIIAKRFSSSVRTLSYIL
jgi:hypothetical protein